MILGLRHRLQKTIKHRSRRREIRVHHGKIENGPTINEHLPLQLFEWL
jgi:hypothetical protein